MQTGVLHQIINFTVNRYHRPGRMIAVGEYNLTRFTVAKKHFHAIMELRNLFDEGLYDTRIQLAKCFRTLAAPEPSMGIVLSGTSG